MILLSGGTEISIGSLNKECPYTLQNEVFRSKLELTSVYFEINHLLDLPAEHNLVPLSGLRRASDLQFLGEIVLGASGVVMAVAFEATNRLT